MSFTPVQLLPSLNRLPGRRLCVAFSGGLDSTVLLYALAALREEHEFHVRAVHIDHGLHPSSPCWASQCIRVGAELGVECTVFKVAVEATGRGPEAAAREARYAALADGLDSGEVLLAAHHADDQAETVLLALSRGSGPAGLAGMPEVAVFGRGYLARPLLQWTRSELEVWAHSAGLTWIEDPSNTDRAITRNHLRHEVLPVLAARWPTVARSIARSARLAAEADGLLEVLGTLDMEALADGRTLDADGVIALGDLRARNLLRTWLRSLGLPPPPFERLVEAVRQIGDARADRIPTVRWSGVILRRWSDRLYADPESESPTIGWATSISPGSPVELPHGLGQLLLRTADQGLDARLVVAGGLTVRFRTGGERLRVHPNGPHRVVKHLLAEAEVPPWKRDWVPLLFHGDTLVAVADMYLDADWAAPEGNEAVVLEWRRH